MRLTLVFTILTSLLYAETIQRDRTALREGPGAWFPLIVELGKGTDVKVLNTAEVWIEVSFGKNRGFISAKALEGKTGGSKDVFAQMAMASPSNQVSQAGVSAAIKGFADRFSARVKSDPETLTYIANYRTNFHTYGVFKQNTIGEKKLRKLRRKFPLRKLKKDQPFTFSETGSGLAVAAKLASLGLVKDPILEQYVNIVGTYVAEQSHGYDIPFRFFILNQDGVNGYACPGGIIFITRGALELMRSEAELACFLGHEITHVVHRHGMKEMEERKEMIIAGNAFDDLSKTIGESAEERRVSLELDDIALDSYETIFQGRLGDYEEEADEIGLLYVARSGYDPQAMIDFLKRVGSSHSMQGTEHYSPSQNQLRITRLSKYLSHKRWQKKGLVLHAERFNKINK